MLTKEEKLFADRVLGVEPWPKNPYTTDGKQQLRECLAREVADGILADGFVVELIVVTTDGESTCH